MTNYAQMDTILVAAAVALLTLACLIIAYNMRRGATDPDTHAGLAYILAANVAMMIGTVSLVLHQLFSDSFTALTVAITFHATFMLGAAGILRGMGRAPPHAALALVTLLFIASQGIVARIDPDIRWVILTSLLVNGVICAVFAITLRRAAVRLGRGVDLLVALPFAIMAAVYAVRLLGIVLDLSEPVLAFGVLMTSFALTFALLVWCFTLQTFGNVRLARKLVVERDRAEEASRMKSRFLANMSHEIRTPLNGVLGMTEILRDHDLGPEERRIVGVIHDSGRTLLHLLNDILDLSKVEAGKLVLEETVFSPFDMITSCAELYRIPAAEKQIELDLDIAPALRTGCKGDPHRIVQVLNNLLNNAMKFTQKGRITLRADLARETMAEDANAWLLVSVADTGIGMTDAQAARIFDDFSQAEDSIARRFGGTGLGLAISKRLIGLMGGHISVTTAPGKGTEFHLRLPLTCAPRSALPPVPPLHAPATDPSGSAAATPSLAGMRILLAEDNRTNQLVVQGMLRKEEIALTIVEDGRDAVALDEAIARGEIADFDLFLFDIQMPVMDGPEAFALIRARRAQAGRAPARAAVLSANALPQQMQAYLDMGFLECLSKPVQKARLIAMLGRIARSMEDEARSRARGREQGAGEESLPSPALR
jgi:signal transduction histidine kinase/DNA-binding NarL/FixJ family response regulator